MMGRVKSKFKKNPENIANFVNSWGYYCVLSFHINEYKFIITLSDIIEII